MTEVVEVGRYVYLLLGFAGMVLGCIGFIGFLTIEHKIKPALVFLGIIILSIISLLLFASTFGRLVW